MKKKYYIIILGILILMIFVYKFFILKEEKRWTPENGYEKIENIKLIDNYKDLKSFKTALDMSIKYYSRKSDSDSFKIAGDIYYYKTMKKSLNDLKIKLEKLGLSNEFSDYIYKNFVMYKPKTENTFFTGYYEALLNGSKRKTKKYKYPLYKKPKDLVKVKLFDFSFFNNFFGLPKIIKGRLLKNGYVIPYYTRKEIDFEQKLKNKKLELLYIDNLIDVFFLQIQGSGIVKLKNGKKIRVNYADSNGQPYKAVGRLLIKENKVSKEKMSMQAIREYLENNPDDLEHILSYDSSYVFFRKVEEGPMGCYGVKVTPFSSIATDRRLCPPCVLGFIEIEIPTFDKNNNIIGTKKINKFVFNHDTGGAIRGPGRIDLFCGNGKKNENIAGHLKQAGIFFILLPKRN